MTDLNKIVSVLCFWFVWGFFVPLSIAFYPQVTVKLVLKEQKEWPLKIGGLSMQVNYSEK